MSFREHCFLAIPVIETGRMLGATIGALRGGGLQEPAADREAAALEPLFEVRQGVCLQWGPEPLARLEARVGPGES
jgi:hypothetical protein